MLLYKDNLLSENFSAFSQLEWLETNGLGGWAGSSLSGCNTRRYHGLLMAAILPPTDRMLLVSKLDETILLDGRKFQLGTNDYGDTIAPGGFQYLSSFKKDFFPEWLFEFGGMRLRKTITMVSGENTTLIRYEVLHAYNNIFWDIEFKNGLFHNQPYQGAPDIFISVPGSSYESVNKWYYA